MLKRNEELKMFRTRICMDRIKSETDALALTVLVYLLERIDKGNLDNTFRVQYLSNGDAVIRCIATEKKYNKLAKNMSKTTSDLVVWNYNIA